MSLAVFALLSAAGVFCLTPVAFYLLWLGSANRRDRPVVVDGTWDFVAVLGAVSGFLLVGGAVVVGAVQSNARYAARGNWVQLRESWDREQSSWLLVAGAYAVAVGAGAAFGIVSRSRSMAVYNLERERLEAVVGEVLSGLGSTAGRFGDVWSDGGPVLRIRPFYGMKHATVTVLKSDPQFRQEFERDFRKRIAAEPATENPAGSWFTSAAVTVSMTIASCLLMLGYLTYAVR